MENNNNNIPEKDQETNNYGNYNQYPNYPNYPNFPNYPNNIVNGVSKTVLILSIIVSLLVGAIGGYFVGHASYSEKIANSNFYKNDTSVSIEKDNNSQNTSNEVAQDENSVTIDYSQYKIGNSGFTIDNYYSDEESKMYASKIIGQKVPNIKWKDSTGKEFNTNDLKGEYIIEFFMTTCVYCNNAIPEVDAFREAHPDMKVYSLSFDTGDLSAFNTKGENAFYIQNLNTDASVAEFTNNMPFVPAVIYVKDGVVQLLTFGGPTQTSMEDAMTVAFGE